MVAEIIYYDENGDVKRIDQQDMHYTFSAFVNHFLNQANRKRWTALIVKDPSTITIHINNN